MLYLTSISGYWVSGNDQFSLMCQAEDILSQAYFNDQREQVLEIYFLCGD